jgi:rhodanese-related sulfurtransferase
MIEQIDAATLNTARTEALAGAVLLDVREPWEFELARIGASINVPMSTLVGRVEEVRALRDAAAAPLVLICHHGSRSMQCAQFLAGQGLGPLINLSGGIDAWSQRVDPSVPRY